MTSTWRAIRLAEEDGFFVHSGAGVSPHLPDERWVLWHASLDGRGQQFRSMVTLAGDFTEILIRQRIISADQLAEAKRLAKDVGQEGGRRAGRASAMPPATK